MARPEAAVAPDPSAKTDTAYDLAFWCGFRRHQEIQDQTSPAAQSARDPRSARRRRRDALPRQVAGLAGAILDPQAAGVDVHRPHGNRKERPRRRGPTNARAPARASARRPSGRARRLGRGRRGSGFWGNDAGRCLQEMPPRLTASLFPSHAPAPLRAGLGASAVREVGSNANHRVVVSGGEAGARASCGRQPSTPRRHDETRAASGGSRRPPPARPMSCRPR